jgi:hypothetical protein
MCLSQHLFCVLHLHTSTIVVGFCNDCECKAYVDTGIGFVLSLVCKQVSFPFPPPLALLHDYDFLAMVLL